MKASRGRLTAVASLVAFWLFCLFDWRGSMWLPVWFTGIILGLSACAAGAYFAQGRSLKEKAPEQYWLRVSLLYIVICPFAVFISDLMVWDSLRAILAQGSLVGLFFIGLFWVIWLLERYWREFEGSRRLDWTPEELL